MKNNLDRILTGSCKMVWIVNTLILVLAYKALAGPVQISVFPGAEGVGKYTLDGRGGDVCCVTNLNDAGPLDRCVTALRAPKALGQSSSRSLTPPC